MKLFKFKKSKKEDSCCSQENTDCCQENIDSLKEEPSLTTEKGIRVLGTGCAKCKKLEANAIAATRELGMNDVIEKITDLAQIATYGVMSTPALWIDGKVVSFGKVLSKDEIISHIKKER